jgi:hypothetical protein
MRGQGDQEDRIRRQTATDAGMAENGEDKFAI